jgi:hypothetical protein
MVPRGGPTHPPGIAERWHRNLPSMAKERNPDSERGRPLKRGWRPAGDPAGRRSGPRSTTDTTSSSGVHLTTRMSTATAAQARPAGSAPSAAPDSARAAAHRTPTQLPVTLSFGTRIPCDHSTLVVSTSSSSSGETYYCAVTIRQKPEGNIHRILGPKFGGRSNFKKKL